MNIVFFGTSEFAVLALRGLLDSKHKVLAVVTQPDRKKGRSLKVSPPPTKVLALTRNVPVYQPQDASGRDSVEYLKRLGADLFVVISFGQILKAEVLAIPKFYSINLHASLLPKYRGAAPTNWALINGERSTGLTVIKMNERMDEGDIILKEPLAIDDEDTNITLSEKLSEAGKDLLLKAMDLIGSEKATFEKQDEKEATYAPKLKKQDGLVDWNDSAHTIHDRVRGLLPWPGAYTHYEGKVLKILNTKTSDSRAEKALKYGEVADVIKDKGIAVRTGSGDLIIVHLQLEGKKALNADSFVLGHRIGKGYIFS